ERRVPEQVELRVRKAQLAADRQGELLHSTRVTGGIRVPRVHRRREGLHGCGRALLEQLVRQLEGDVLRLDRLGSLAELQSAALSVLEVRLLRLPHQQERHCEHGQREQLNRLVRKRHHAADEAVDEVVRQEPGEALPEDGPPALVPLHRQRERDEAHVDGEVGRACEQSEARRGELVRSAVREEGRDLEDTRRGKGGQGEGADVEEDVVQRRPAGTPFDRHARKGKWQRSAEAEERRGRETTYGADGQYRRPFVGLEPESLPYSDQADDGQ